MAVTVAGTTAGPTTAVAVSTQQAVDTPDQRSARDRLLDAADELFYAEGVHVVGIDRIIARAGVAKASLYNCFGSKEELVRAYLQRRYERRKDAINRTLEPYDTPRERILAVYDYLDDMIRRPDFRGCPFQRASAESSPDVPSAEVGNTSRAWTRELFTELVRAMVSEGKADPAALGQQLVLLYDGAIVSAELDRDLGAARAAKAAADALLGAALH
jgi:AcrR family transcriptional regulator